MKRIFYALFACLLLAMPALAGQNVRQNDDGGAVWVDGDGNTMPVGDTGIVIYVDDFSEPLTNWVVTHRKGKIKKVYSVVNDGFSGNIVLDFGHRGSGLGEGTNDAISSPSGVANTLTITASGSAGGDVDTLDTSDWFNTSVTPGQSIYIHGDGGASTAVSGSIVIIVE